MESTAISDVDSANAQPDQGLRNKQALVAAVRVLSEFLGGKNTPPSGTDQDRLPNNLTPDAQQAQVLVAADAAKLAPLLRDVLTELETQCEGAVQEEAGPRASVNAGSEEVSTVEDLPEAFYNYEHVPFKRVGKVLVRTRFIGRLPVRTWGDDE